MGDVITERQYAYYKVLIFYAPSHINMLVSEAGASFELLNTNVYAVGDYDIRDLRRAPGRDMRLFTYYPLRCNMFSYRDDIWDGRTADIMNMHGG